MALQRFTFRPSGFGSRPLCPGSLSTVSHYGRQHAGGLASATELEAQTPVWNGNRITYREGEVEGRAPRRLGPVGTHPAAGHELHPDLTNRGKGSEAARKLGEEQETLAKENRKWRAERSVAPEPLAAGGRARCPYQASSRSPPPHPDVPRGSHLAAPWPGAGGWLVPGLSSSSSSLSREGLRGAKNREKVCQGAPPLLRPPDISPARLPVRGRPRGTGEALSCARSPAWRDPAKARRTRRRPPARLSSSPAGEARTRRAPRAAAALAAPGSSYRPRLARPREEPEAAAPPGVRAQPWFAWLAGSPREAGG